MVFLDCQLNVGCMGQVQTMAGTCCQPFPTTSPSSSPTSWVLVRGEVEPGISISTTHSGQAKPIRGDLHSRRPLYPTLTLPTPTPGHQGARNQPERSSFEAERWQMTGPCVSQVPKFPLHVPLSQWIFFTKHKFNDKIN